VHGSLKQVWQKKNDLRTSITSQPYNLPLWKAICKLRDDFQSNIIWQIGNGNVNFWMHKWGPNNSSLIYITTISYLDTTLSIKDVVTPSGNWEQNFLFDNLPNNIVE